MSKIHNWTTYIHIFILKTLYRLLLFRRESSPLPKPRDNRTCSAKYSTKGVIIRANALSIKYTKNNERQFIKPNNININPRYMHTYKNGLV